MSTFKEDKALKQFLRENCWFYKDRSFEKGPTLSGLKDLMASTLYFKALLQLI